MPRDVTDQGHPSRTSIIDQESVEDQ